VSTVETSRLVDHRPRAMLERRLRVRSVTKRFGSKRVLHGASLEVHPGRTLGIIGANGAGKTTLLRMILGLVRPDAGVITLNGRCPAEALRTFPIAYVGSGAALPGHAKVFRWARLFSRTGPLLSDRRRIRTLSRGQRQLVGLQAGLGRRAFELVILDEPWESLDPQGSEWLTRCLDDCRSRGAMVVLSSHRLADLADVCDSYAILHRGRVTVIDADRFRVPGQAVADRLRAAYLTLTCVGSRG
jgi:ABC-2 type transport system ATP-binding protein